jgi:DNA-binding response OmpR family regulator
MNNTAPCPPELRQIQGKVGDIDRFSGWEVSVLVLLGEDAWIAEALCRLRQQGARMPILALRTDRCVEGACRLLNSDIDAYLPNDCDAQELMAVLAALERRGASVRPNAGEPLELLPLARALRLRNREFQFGPVGFLVISYLVTNRGRWVSQREIVERAIGVRFQPDSAVARVQVHELRKRLGEYRACIQQDGRRGCGYRFELVPDERAR